MTTNLVATFAQAAAIIRTNGHYKGSYVGLAKDSSAGLAMVERPVCIAGALAIALTGNPVPALDGGTERDRYDVVAARLADLIGVEGDPLLEPVGRLAGWNDSPDRTANDVIAALEAAAKAVAS